VLNANQILRVAGVVVVSFVLTAVLGLVRQALIGSYFGTSSELDAFFAGNRVSETLFTLISGGALGSAFIPVFARFLTADDTAGASRLAAATMSWVSIVGVVFCLLAWLFAHSIVDTLLIPGATAAQQALTVDLMRIMLVTVILFSISGLCMAILNANQRFFAASLTPGMYNIGLIIGIVAFVPRLGIYGLAWGSVLGSLLHLAIQIPALYALRFRPAFRLDLQTPGLREVLSLMLPRVLGLAAFQANFWVNSALITLLHMAEGSLSALSLAFVLLFTVLGVIGQSVGTAVFPTLSALNAQQDMDGFRRVLGGAMRGVLFVAIPATIGLIILAVPVVQVIFGRGGWTPTSTNATAWALSLYAPGLAGFALQEILARSFYARRNTWIPVSVAVGGLFLNVLLSLILVRVIQGAAPGQGPFGGLALANALTTLAETAILYRLMRRRLGHIDDRQLFSEGGRTLIAALVMGAAVLALDAALADRAALLRLLIGAGVGALIFEGGAALLGVSEARAIPRLILRRIRR
jgi:putative peptidoglycan lipid II flippase